MEIVRNLGGHDGVNESPVLSDLLRGHLLCQASARLIVVQESNEGLERRPPQHLVLHVGEQRVLGFVISPV